MRTPVRQALCSRGGPRWSVRAVGNQSAVPDHIRDRSIRASVPGCIHTDLMDAGLIPDAAVGANEQQVQWVSWTDWRYECEFEADRRLFDQDEIDLVFDCLDTIASVELNCDVIGRAASEFIPHRFGVLGLLKPGRNTLAVTFKSPLRHIQEEAARLEPRPVNGDSAPYNMIRKCASNFGWDWGPKVATCGITQGVLLEAGQGASDSAPRATAPHATWDGSRFMRGGRVILVRGANWIPEGLWPRDRTPERVRKRLQQMVDCGMNMVRVWGGGRYEPDWFYDLCDELGLMVWQDFMFSCACYPEEEPLRALIEAEARFQVARLSRHPCIVLWCGGNECQWAHESWGFKEKLKPSQTWGRHYWQELLPRVMRELDPARPYWPDSPWSGDEKIHPNDPDHGDRHTWDVWGHGYRSVVPRFCSEFGQQGPSNYSTLAKAGLVTPEAGEIVPRALAARQLGPGGMSRWYEEPMKAWFRPPQDFDEWHYLAQLLQARSLAIGIEWMRANSEKCSGALVWQMNDAWPGLSWSLIDSEGRKKPAWYAVRRAMLKENPSPEPELREPLVENPRIEGALVCRGNTQKLVLRAQDTVKDIVIALDRLHPEAELEDQCFTLRSGECRQLAIASPAALTVEQIMSAPVFRCANGFDR